MSGSVGGEDCDIYTDLPAFNADYEEENKKLKETIKILENKLRILEKEKHQINGKYLQTQRNISSLFKTAVTEVNRKKRTIDDLRTQLENSVFRRSKRQRTESPVREKSKPEFRIPKAEQKSNKFSDCVNKSSEEEYESESKDRSRLVIGDSDKAMRDVAVPVSHKNKTDVSSTAPNSSVPRRLLQHHTPANTLYTRRLLDRFKTGQRDLHHTNENKSHVEDDKSSITKQAVNTSRNTEVKCEPSVDMKPSSKHSSADAIHKIDQSQNITLRNDDADCMIMDVKQELSSTTKVCLEPSLRGSIVKSEPHDGTKSDVIIIGSSSPLVSDFRRRRRAKVISVSTGNKILFESPHSIGGIRNVNSGTDHSTNNITKTIKCEETSWQSNDDKSAIKREALPLLRDVTKYDRFLPFSQQSGVRTCATVDHLKSDGVDSVEESSFQCNTGVHESSSAVEVLREQCADMNINKAEEVNLSKSAKLENMCIGESSKNTFKSSLPIQEKSNFAPKFSDMRGVKSENGEITLTNAELPSTTEPKCITRVRRRRKPVSLGDSSFVVGDSSKS